MANHTEKIVSDLFSSISEETLATTVNQNKFINFGEAFREFMLSHNLTKNDVISSLVSSPFEKTAHDSIRKNVENWLNNRHKMSRETAFHLCILLNMSIDDSMNFFSRILGEKWVHYRNIKDVIYDFCIRYSYSIDVAHALVHKYTNETDNNKNIVYTVIIKRQYNRLISKSDDKLKQLEVFLENNIENFSSIRATLYNYFISMLLKPNVVCGEKHLKYTNGKAAINTNYLSGVLLETDIKMRKANQDDLRIQKSIRVLLDNYLLKHAEIQRDIFIKCSLISGIDDVDTMNDILLECGLNDLYPRDRFDAWIFDALVNSEDQMAYYRLVDTKTLFFPISDH